MSRKQARRRGFTLIELLVVISIIALLVGILLPALSAARGSALGVVCQTHMKNLSTAHVAYGADAKAMWPSWAIVRTPTLLNAGSWVPYTDLRSPNPGTEKDLSEGALWPYTPDLEVFVCPSDPYAHFSSGLSYSISSHIYHPPTRDFNVAFNARAADWPGNPMKMPQFSVEPAIAITLPGSGSEHTRQVRYPNSDKFVAPSNLIFLVDEGGPGFDLFPSLPAGWIGVNDGLFQNLYSDEPGGNGAKNASDKTKWYHRDQAAFGFADGHGELRSRTDREVISFNRSQRTPTGRFFPYGRIWDPAAEAPEIAE